jgi:hypothetical protein
MAITGCQGQGQSRKQQSIVSAPSVKRLCADTCQEVVYPLHALMQASKNVSVENVMACLEHHPNAAKAMDGNKRTPIFYAVQQGFSDQMFETLFEAFSQGILQVDVMGQTALGLLYQASKSPKLLHFVFEKQPSLAIWKPKTFSGRMWVDYTCQNWDNACLAQVENNPTAWEKLVCTVKAAHRATFDQPIGQDEELHVAIEMKLSAHILGLFLELYPHQVFQPMKRSGGMLPLHFAVSQAVNKKSFSKACFVRCLIEKYPQSTAVAYQGQYPLHAALAHGREWTDGIQELVFAFPSVIHIADPDSKLYPVMIAASSDVCSLNTIFCLLKESPLL